MSEPEQNEPDLTPEELGHEAGSRAMDAALRSSFVILKVVIAVLVVYLLFSNTFTVEDQQEGAIVLRLGESRTPTSEVWKPGMRFALPYPLESIERLERESPISTEFGWTQDRPRDPSNPTQDPNAERRIMAANPEEGYLLTKDDKAIHLKATMAYSITDANRYVFGYYEPKNLLKLLLENALTHVVRRYEFEDVRPERVAIGKEVEEELKALMIKLELGVAIKTDSVSLDFGDGKNLEHIPAFARKSWDAYSSANANGATILAKANKIAEDMAGTVRAEVTQTVDAEKEAVRQRIALLNRVANQHASILKNNKTPAELQARMREIYHETIQELAANPELKIFLVPKGTGSKPNIIRLQINQPPADKN